MEWANEGEGVTVGALRERVGRDWRGKDGVEEGTRGKKRKLDLDGGKGEEMDGLEG